MADRVWTMQGPPRIVDLFSARDGHRQRAFEYELVGSDGTRGRTWVIGVSLDDRLPGWRIENPEELP